MAHLISNEEQPLSLRYPSAALRVTEEQFNYFLNTFIPRLNQRPGYLLMKLSAREASRGLEYALLQEGNHLFTIHIEATPSIIGEVPPGLLFRRKNRELYEQLMAGSPRPRSILFLYPEPEPIERARTLYEDIYAFFGQKMNEYLPYSLLIEIQTELRKWANHSLLNIELLEHQQRVGEYIAYYANDDNSRIIRYSGNDSEEEFQQKIEQEFPDTYAAFAIVKIWPELLDLARIEKDEWLKIIEEFEGVEEK